MREIYIKARAKINLSLEILGKRPDGYHDLKSVMQTLSLHDGLTMKRVDKDGYLKLVCNVPWLPTDERNLAVKAVKAIKSRYGLGGGVFIELRKNIPVSAGLGGGSTDCAAALLGMAVLYNLRIPFSDLLELGASLGADVPFCLLGGTALAEGIGEKLKVLTPHPYAYVLVVKPPFSISTAEVFSRVKLGPVQQRPSMEAAIESRSLSKIMGSLNNDLWPVTTQMAPSLSGIRAEILSLGAVTAQMSGSGPSIFAYFPTKNAMDEAAERLSDRHPQFGIHPSFTYNGPRAIYGRSLGRFAPVKDPFSEGATNGKIRL